MAERSPNDVLRAALPWLVAVVVVLAVSVTAGFVTAYLVASGRAVVPPNAGVGPPTPRATAVTVTIAPEETAHPSAEPTRQPRRTPIPEPIATAEPPPFEHVIQRGESLEYIAVLYCTTTAAIVELNEIENPNRIFAGYVLLIPGGGCPEPAPS